MEGQALAMDLTGATVVITGASSGIGRASALAFARHGARLVLAGRDPAALEELAGICRAHGDVLVVATDTTDAAQVLQLAQAATDFGGGVDVWVNNAGVASFGPFLEAPLAAHEQVIRTNLLGYLYGAYAVLPIFQAQQRGVLINVISMAGFVPTPLASSYSASKHGARGLAEALRLELRAMGGDIHICDVHPAFVDTPMLERTANYSGRRLKPVPPVIPVDAVARKIVQLARRPRATAPMGVAFPVSVGFHRLAPAVFREVVGRTAQLYLKFAPAAPRTSAALFGPTQRVGRASGDLRSPLLRLAVGGGLLALAITTGAMLTGRSFAARQDRARA
jgi:short-subunit dehydrogenase